MTYASHYECTLCGRTFPFDGVMTTCPSCGETGILDIVYDYEAMKQTVTKASFRENPDFSIWRYLPLLSIAGTRHEETLHTGWTPLYETKKLAEVLGLKRLFVKDEGLNPTASLKDRPSAVAVLDAIARGYDTVACSSTGNAASSLAGQAARMGLHAVIFVPKRAPVGKLNQLLAYGATVIAVDGDYKAAFELSKRAIAHYGWYDRNAAINPHLVEGKKTVSLELAEQLGWDVPDWVVVSVGDGCTVAGVYKGFYDLFRLGITPSIPRILGVQSSGCAPFVTASESGYPLVECEENTIADSIAVGIPRNPVKAQRAIAQSNGAWIAVSDEAILAMMKTLGSAEGIFGEPAGVAGLAGLKAAVAAKMIQPHERVVALMTGNGLKDPANAGKAVGSPALLKPDLQELIDYMKRKHDKGCVR
ncbi:MAG: threonine synthase [Bacillota bacterium]|nr:threonine synthase [Bacillota bacterium]